MKPLARIEFFTLLLNTPNPKNKLKTHKKLWEKKKGKIVGQVTPPSHARAKRPPHPRKKKKNKTPHSAQNIKRGK